MRSPTVLVLELLIFLLIPTYAQCNQQIFYKSLNHTELPRNQFDPKQGIYPVIQLSVDCPYYPVTSCPNDAFDEETIREFCRLQKLCPNGTQPQCVENKEYVWKDVLWICSPIRKCDSNARSVVYVDSSTPNVSSYQLGKEMCNDGYYHSNNNDPRENYCFSMCQENVEIQVYQKRTANSGPIVYCNNQVGYCNPEIPKLFELQDTFSPCFLPYERGYNPCNAGFDRLPDCTCDARCHDGLRRDPADDFKCKRLSEIFPSIDTVYLRDIVKIYHHSSGFRLKWRFQHAGSSTIESITVVYREIGDSEETHLNYTSPTDNNPDHSDLEGLLPGKMYIITVRIVYTYEGKERNSTLERRKTTLPKPIVRLTASIGENNINLTWVSPNGSWQDHYLIEYKMVGRQQKLSWVQSTSTGPAYELKDPFPGEEYEFRVYSVSINTTSDKKSTHVIVPPLQPEKLHAHFSAFSTTVVTISWSHDEQRSHVKFWDMRYNTSGGVEGQRNVLVPDYGKRVEVTLLGIRPGEIYTVFVQSSVEDVVSIKRARVDFEMPEKEEKTDGVPIIVYILAGIIFLILVAVCCLVLYIFRKAPAVRQIRNYFNIRKVEANIGSSNGDVNIHGPLLDGLGLTDNESSGPGQSVSVTMDR